MEDFNNQNNINYAQEMPNFYNNDNNYDNIIYNSLNNFQDFTSFPNNNINFIDTPFLNIVPDITFTISFSTGEKYTFSDNPNNLFQTTFDKFFKEKNLEYMKNYIKFVVHDGKTVKFNKTLSENNIKDNSIILIMFYDISNNNNILLLILTIILVLILLILIIILILLLLLILKKIIIIIKY